MKSIVVFSDGTGNSSAKLFKTNVYRLYQAVEIADPPPNSGIAHQVVTYDSGVGTSSFKPLALLGGAFGVGLKRNVLDLYRFICRHYQEGDRIYAFGFSRGAFTIRVLIGLVTQMGVVKAEDKAVLDALTADAYREFRKCFRLSGNRMVVDDEGYGREKKRRDLTELLVDPLRNLRHAWFRRRRVRQGLPPFTEMTMPVKEIAFVGVWDTVAAYGFPIAEITKGIDRWIWPLSMPDYKLSEKVKTARHALALDDERDTFHPLLWDEVHERELVKKGKVAEDRLRQVWFAGMHSDVGGGYSDDALSYVSLVWMGREAIARGLRLKEGSLEEFERMANQHGPMHDSRSGLGAYYRYQPRKIGARLEMPDPTTLLQQDPDMKGRGLLTHVRIHSSVIARMLQKTDHYAPIVLPAEYEVVDGAAPEKHSKRRAEAQERVWDDVWRRRVNYFLTLGVTAWTVLFPITLPAAAETCVGPQCLLSPVISVVGGWLPDFLAPWFEGYAARPGTFLVSVLFIVMLMLRATRLETSLRDRMHRLQMHSCSTGADAAAAIDAEAEQPGFVRRLRTSSGYQKNLRWLKWNAGPAMAAGVVYTCGALVFGAVLLGILGAIHRGHMSLHEYTLAYCANVEQQPSPEGNRVFSTANLCHRLPFPAVEAGKRYRLRLAVTESWKDKDIQTSPAGFDSARFGWSLRPWAWMFRRSFNDPWFSPILAVENGGKRSGGAFSVPMKLVDLDQAVYAGYFTAPATGKLVLSVNDAVFLWGRPWGMDTSYFYNQPEGKNYGSAKVWLDDCAMEARVPCE